MTQPRASVLVATAFFVAACGSDAAPQAVPATDSLVTVPPADEAARDPGFFVFRAELQRAIAARDTSALLAVLAPDVRLSFGGDHGRDRFVEMWLEADPPRSGPDVWTRLAEVLALGGRFMDDTTFVAPYTFHPFGDEPAPADFDGFTALFAIGDSVPILAAPRAGADTLAVVSFAKLTIDWDEDGEHYGDGWRTIQWTDGGSGYVRADRVRSPIDYRAGFARGADGWRMTFFIAGD